MKPAVRGPDMAFWYPHNNANRFESSFAESEKGFLRDLESGREMSRRKDPRYSVGGGGGTRDRAAAIYSNDPSTAAAPALTGSFADVSNLRAGPNSSLPAGRCVYINSVDSCDFDNYLAAAALSLVANRTPNMELATVVATRRACKNRTEGDADFHDEAFSNEVMDASGKLLRALCPNAHIVRGPLNQKGILTQQIIPHEPETYGPALGRLPKDLGPGWETLQDLAGWINAPTTTSVMMDMLGPVGWVEKLEELCPELGPKLRAAPFPIPVLGGVLAEKELNLQVPNYAGCDQRSTLNALKHRPDALLRIAQQHSLRLLVVTPYVCRRLLRFEDAAELVGELGLSGLLAKIAMCYYGRHLEGEFVPADWVATVATMLVRRHPGVIRTERRELYVGVEDKSVMVLMQPGAERSERVADLKYWGVVEALVEVDREMLVSLARSLHYSLADRAPHAVSPPAKGTRRPATATPGGAPSRPFSEGMYTPGGVGKSGGRSSTGRSRGGGGGGGVQHAPLPLTDSPSDALLAPPARSTSPSRPRSAPPRRPDLSNLGGGKEGYVEGSNIKSKDYGDMRYLPIYKSQNVQNSIAMARHYKRVPVQQVELQSAVPVAKAYNVKPGVKATVKLWDKPWWRYEHSKYYGFAGRGARTSWAHAYTKPGYG